MDRVIKVLSSEVKEVPEVSRTLQFTGSNESMDRAGDIIECAGWDCDHYVKNPVFLWAHDYRQPPIGKATKVWVDNGQLKFHIEFASKDTYEFADTIYKLYKGGFLNAVSVGFEPTEWEPIDTKDEHGFHGGRRYKKQSLLELSGCPVPCNPEALQNAVKQGVVTVKDMDSLLATHRKKSLSQAEIKDELDYVLSIIGDGLKFSDENIALATEINKRLSANDIAVGIATKGGQMDKKKHTEHLMKIQELAQKCMDDMGEDMEDKPKLLTNTDIKALIKEAVAATIAQASGKLN